MWILPFYKQTGGEPTEHYGEPDLVRDTKIVRAMHGKLKIRKLAVQLSNNVLQTPSNIKLASQEVLHLLDYDFYRHQLSCDEFTGHGLINVEREFTRLLQ